MQHYESEQECSKRVWFPGRNIRAVFIHREGNRLAQAEVAMLHSYVQKADLHDGQTILDLGYERCF